METEARVPLADRAPPLLLAEGQLGELENGWLVVLAGATAESLPSTPLARRAWQSATPPTPLVAPIGPPLKHLHDIDVHPQCLVYGSHAHNGIAAARCPAAPRAHPRFPAVLHISSPSRRRHCHRGPQRVAEETSSNNPSTAKTLDLVVCTNFVIDLLPVGAPQGIARYYCDDTVLRARITVPAHSSHTPRTRSQPVTLLPGTPLQRNLVRASHHLLFACVHCLRPFLLASRRKGAPNLRLDTSGEDTESHRSPTQGASCHIETASCGARWSSASFVTMSSWLLALSGIVLHF
jgi:hypothetical protein